MNPTRYHRLRRSDGSLGPIVEGALPADVRGECEGVVWMQLPGRRQAVRGELWSEGTAPPLPPARPPVSERRRRRRLGSYDPLLADESDSSESDDGSSDEESDG